MKINKKISFIICFILTIFSTNVSAKELEKTFSAFILEQKEQYLENLGKTSEKELTNLEELELTKIVDTLKRNILNKDEKTNRWINPALTLTGYIYATNDSPAGHAGIGGKIPSGSGDLGYTIEANPGIGVQFYSNRYNSYWKYKVTGGIYSVIGATSTKYNNASNWANNQVGKQYSLNPFDGDSAFYCSELVYRAWEVQGIKVGTFFITVTPASIMNHQNTNMIKAFVGE